MKRIIDLANSKTVEVVMSIVRSEDLDVSLSFETNAIGDTVIVASGSRDDVSLLCEIYDMVGRN